MNFCLLRFERAISHIISHEKSISNFFVWFGQDISVRIVMKGLSFYRVLKSLLFYLLFIREMVFGVFIETFNHINLGSFEIMKSGIDLLMSWNYFILNFSSIRNLPHWRILFIGCLIYLV